MPESAIIFGAGNIGRGFLGQLFSESGYLVTFVDVDTPLLEALNQRGEYTIRLVTNQSSIEVTVGPVRAIHAQDQPAVAAALEEAKIGATAVGARALPHVAPNVAAGIARRAKQGLKTPLNLILCENLKGAADYFRGITQAELAPAYHAYFTQSVGFVDSVIARMIPPLSSELRAQDPSLIIAEPYKELPVNATQFIGPPPEIVGLIPAFSFSFYTERKLYMHNAAHAIMSYLGYPKGYTYGYETLADPQIAAAVSGALAESAQALTVKYGLSPDSLETFTADILARLGNRALADTVFRLARDPIRKLAHSDRLVGAALSALEQGVEPAHLVTGIVAALKFDAPDDPFAVQLQTRLQQAGLQVVLKEICGLEPDSPLAQRIQAKYTVAGST